MTQQMQTNDITTRLLAQENLLIQRAPVKTASFDVVNRILTLPQWQNMTPEIEEMLKAHEVAHALYTDFDNFEEAKEAEGRKGLHHGYLNVLEDARIEKLMKRKYPGLRTVFNKGYAQLNERDFFDLKKHDVAKLTLIDRINLYYKAGYNCGVKFTPAEKYLVDQVARLETIEDVVTLGRKIFDFAKKTKEQQRKEMLESAEYQKMLNERNDEDEFNDDIDDSFFEDDDYLDDDDRHEYFGDPAEDEESSDKEEKGQTGSGRATDEETQTDPFIDTDAGPVTVRALEEKLAESADVNTKYTYIDMVRMTGLENEIIIPYKKVLADNENGLAVVMEKITSGKINEYYAERYKAAAVDILNEYEKFMPETQRVVAYLVKEFEMRKAATDYKRVQIAKSGILDTRKLAQFKIREDLFKSIAVTKDGKKHGLLFILDWSGSMSDYLNDTVKQLISLVMFCHRIKIPFQVFAFTDDGTIRNMGLTDEQIKQTRERKSNYLISQATNTIGVDADFNLIEMFSHRMSNSDFNKMCKTVFYMSRGFVADGYNLSGTPLNEALTFLYDYSETFVRNNQIEKFTLIKLTDGDGGRVSYYNKKIDDTSDSHDRIRGYTTSSMLQSYDWDGQRKIRYVRFLRCPVTKKVYSVDGNTQWGNLITQMIKDRYDCGSIGFHVTDKRARDINYAMATYNLATSDEIVYEARRDMLKEGFAGLKVYGHDELFLLKSDHKVDETEMSENMTGMTASAIARQFSKHLSAKKTSRVLLNRFVGVVA